MSKKITYNHPKYTLLTTILALLGCIGLLCVAACQNKGVGLLSSQNSSATTATNEITALLKQGKLSKANHQLDSLLAQHPNEAQFHNLKGLTLARMDKLHEGLAELDKAIALNPNLPEPYYNKGLIWYKFQDKVKARQFFDQALNLNAQYADVYFQRGVLNFQEFKKDSACLDWNRAVNLGYDDKLKYREKFCK